MARRLILETTFLIDLEREAAQSVRGSAHAFLDAGKADSLYLTVTTAGELAAGRSLSSHAAWETLIARFQVLEVDRKAAWEYGQAYRHLQANGLLIGANDLWIAATALARGMPVVTRNTAHFGRVPGLEVISYAA